MSERAQRVLEVDRIARLFGLDPSLLLAVMAMGRDEEAARRHTIARFLWHNVRPMRRWVRQYMGLDLTRAQATDAILHRRSRS